MVEKENNDDRTAVTARERSAAAPIETRPGHAAAAAPPTDVQAYIGRQLRAVYDDVAKQPIPDRFLALMQQLESKGAG